MDHQLAFASAHAEHAEILDFLYIWEGALNLLSSSDCDTRCSGLRQLQTLEGKIAEICDHCRREEDDPESPLFRFAETADRGRMKDEHFRLCLANYEFRKELEYTTSSSTDELLAQGRRLLTALRGHITYEEGLLRRFELQLQQPMVAAAAGA